MKKHNSKILFAILMITVIFTATACGTEQPKQSSNDKVKPVDTPIATKIVGEEGKGFVSVPDHWIKFLEIEGGTDFQYSDPSGTSIITLNFFDDSALTQDQKNQMTAEIAAKNVWFNIENNGAKNIEGAKVTLQGHDAYQVYATYDDGTVLVTWSLEDENGKIYYVSAEAPAPMITDVISYVENSYSIEQ